uniref:Uncharacterized protein n=1 Tax=mine drainage metagenome TaxID=410659 RepID=E6QKA9_9ZZZZ
MRSLKAMSDALPQASLFKALLPLFASALVLTLTACMGSTPTLPGQNPKPTSVLFSGAPTSMPVGTSATIDASAVYANSVVINPATNTPNMLVNYSLQCGSANCGMLAGNVEVGAATYTAPAAVPTGSTVTITATAQADSAISAKATITITPPPPPTLTFVAPVQGSVQAGAQAQYAVTIANDPSATPQVNWTVACTGAACGAVAPTTTTSGQKVTYTAPAATSNGLVVTLTATSVSTPSDSVSTDVAILPPAQTLASGSYVFQLQSSYANGSPAALAMDTGVFTAANGVVTGGEEDLLVNSFCGGYTGQCPPAQASEHKVVGGSYTGNSDGTTKITLQLDSGTTQTLTGVVSANGQGFTAQIDGVPALVSLRPQTSTAAPKGGYAFALNGQSYDQGPAWMTGVLNIDGTNSASGNGSVLDIPAPNLSYGGEEALAATAVTAPDSYGRIVFALSPAASDNVPFPPVYVAGYVIDSGHMALMEVGDQTDNSNFQGQLMGQAVSQGAQTGAFTAAGLANQSYVFGVQGLSNNGYGDLAGVLTFNATGGVSGLMTISDLSGTQAQQPLQVTGSYTIEANGRIAITNVTNGSIYPWSMVMDLAENGRALAMTYTGQDIAGGEAYLRATSTFSATSLNGAYGLNASVLYTAPSATASVQSTAQGSVSAIPGGSSVDLTGFANIAVPAANTSESNAISGSFSPATDGVMAGTLTGLNVTSPTKAGQFTLYQIDTGHALVIEDDSAQETLGLLTAQP